MRPAESETGRKTGLGFGPERLLGGLALSLGLILAIVGGAELFTVNSLIVFAFANRKFFGASPLRNWVPVYRRGPASA